MRAIIYNKYVLMPILLLIFSGCGQYKPLATVKSVDLARYAGKWYEIASFPQRFQKGCTCTVAEYTPTTEGYIEVFNSCRKDSVTGRLSKAKGKAFIEKSSGNAKLEVQFFWPFRGKYWIIDLAEDYSYAVVGHPNRDYLWILSRSSHMTDSLYHGILLRVSAIEFDTLRLQKTKQI